MKSLLKDDHLLNRPTTAGVKYNSNTATRKRPLTASPNRKLNISVEHTCWGIMYKNLSTKILVGKIIMNYA